MLAAIARAIILEERKIPALTAAAPDHRAIIVVRQSNIAIGSGLNVDDQRLNADPATCCLLTEANLVHHA